MKTMTLKIYKNEIDATRLAFISKHFSRFMESPKVLIVSGSRDDILKLYNNYLRNDAQFKLAFPEYMTYEENSI